MIISNYTDDLLNRYYLQPLLEVSGTERVWGGILIYFHSIIGTKYSLKFDSSGLCCLCLILATKPFLFPTRNVRSCVSRLVIISKKLSFHASHTHHRLCFSIRSKYFETKQKTEGTWNKLSVS